MKNIRFMALAMAVIMLSVCMISCSGNGGTVNGITVNCTVSVVVGDNYILDEFTYDAVGTETEAPTILKAVTDALLVNDIEYLADENGFESISDVEGNVYENGADNYFWICTIDGEEIRGRAGNVTVEEGQVIVYTFSPITGE